MKLTFLGTGTSTGVPEIGCCCEVCTSNDPRDNRLRSSVLLEVDGKNILIDCGPDFRMQMLRYGVSRIDAVLITHEHYDHVGGLDDLRPFSFDKDMKIFAEANVLEAIQVRMPYVVPSHHCFGLPRLALTPVGLMPFNVEGVSVTPIRVMHGRLPILGYRIGNIAYLTDVKTIPEEEYEKLSGLDFLIIDALRKDNRHHTHAGLDEALLHIERIRPKQAFLTHMSHKIGLHSVIEADLPSNVHFAYDGLQV